jgi:hypothetical protein
MVAFQLETRGTTRRPQRHGFAALFLYCLRCSSKCDAHGLRRAVSSRRIDVIDERTNASRITSCQIRLPQRRAQGERAVEAPSL